MIEANWYHGTIEKSIIAFGTLFGNIWITRAHPIEGEDKRFKVPLTLGNKEKVLALVQEDPDRDKRIAQTLPRIAFEMVSFMYDPQRKIGKTQYLPTGTETADSRQRLFAPVPYTMQMEMEIITKYYEDGLQIVEQILPWFQPEMNITIFDTPGMAEGRDVPIVLMSAAPTDDYEGGVDTKRLITWNLSFEMKINLYRPLNEGKVIRKVQVDIHDTPTLENWIQRYTATVTPPEATRDDYSVEETWDDKTAG